MRVDSFAISELDDKINEWLGNHYDFEKFSFEKSHLEEHLLPLVNEIQSFGVKTVIVGGTNGKGEVSLHLEEMALQNDYYPVLWTSPHILCVRERFSYNGEMIAAETLLNLFYKHSHLSEDFSYYEFLFFCFCDHLLTLLKSGIANDKILIILEVGLGGRLDATNFFNADVACLTSVGRDHMEILGDKLSDILREKIEISRSDKYLVSGVTQTFLIKEIKDYCDKKNVNLEQLSFSAQDNFRNMNLQLAQTIWHKLFTKKLGAYKKKMLWARPLVVTDKRHEFILLGTHNLDGLKKLPVLRFDEEMAHFLPANEILLAMTRTNKRDVEQFISLLSTLPCLGKKIVLTSFDHKRATELSFITDSLGTLMERENIVVCEDWKKRLTEQDKDNKILVLGSYFFMGEVFKFLYSRGYTLVQSLTRT